jgi:hypothetical protein
VDLQYRHLILFSKVHISTAGSSYFKQIKVCNKEPASKGNIPSFGKQCKNEIENEILGSDGGLYEDGVFWNIEPYSFEEAG